MDRKKIDLVIRTYLETLSQKIKIEKVILFGSSLAERPDEDNEDKDIDLLILSPSFAKMSDDKRFDLLYTNRTNHLTQSTPMDIFGLTPKEFNQASPLSIVGEIKETGREVFTNK